MTTRILHVFGRMDRGGAEVRTLEVMRRIDRARYRFDFCVISGRAGMLDGEIRALGGEVYPIAAGPLFPLRFAALLLRHRYRAVHSHVHYFGALPLLVAWLCRVPVRIAHFRTTHDGKPDTLPRRAARAVWRAVLDAAATRVLGVSRASLDAVWGRDWENDRRCRVVYNGVETALFDAKTAPKHAKDALFALHVARLDPAKNHAKVLSVFAEIARQRPEARLLLAGPRPGESPELERAIAGLGLSERVTLGGCREDIPELMAAADVMLFPSLREGLPGALLEALAAGLPVVASNIPPIREIAERVRLGLETLPLDASDELWAERALALAAQGRQGISLAGTPFALEDTVRAFEGAYAGALR